MIRISLPFLMNTARSLARIEAMPEEREPIQLDRVWSDAFEAFSALGTLLQGSVFEAHLRSSVKLALELQAKLRPIAETNDYMRVIPWIEIWDIKRTYERYRTALLAELEVSPAFFVNQKAAYDTESLLTQGSKLFPADLWQKVPQAIFDVQEATKALAFELPTACGYHAFRATESVLRSYYEKTTGLTVSNRNHAIGHYVRLLKRQESSDARVVSMLEQFAMHHRNPVIHPEVVLTMPEAVATLGIAQSVIIAMLNKIPPPDATTMTPPAPVPDLNF